MAQHASESLPSVALEGIPASVPPSLALASTSSPFLHAFRFKVHDDPLHTPGRSRTSVNLEPVTEFVSVATTQVPKVPPLVPFLGFPVSGIQPAMAISAIGLDALNLVALVSPSVDTPLHPGSSVDETSTMRAQHLIATVQKLRGMVLPLATSSLPPPPTPEVPVQPTLALQAHPTAPSPLSSPQLLAAPTMKAMSPLSALHPPPTSVASLLGWQEHNMHRACCLAPYQRSNCRSRTLHFALHNTLHTHIQCISRFFPEHADHHLLRYRTGTLALAP